MEIQTQESAVPISSAQGIDVRRIEKELAAMWQQSAGTEGSEEAGVVRACALNLIVYTTADEDRAQIDELLATVNEQHPGRALVLLADDRSSAARLEAYVSSRCRLLGANKRHVCGEQVMIEAVGPSIEAAASAIAALLVPDVPVFLWWKDIPHEDNRLFNRMARMADRVVIDSAAFDHPREDLLRLAALVGELGKETRISDLNWGRLTSWRMLLASFWDVAEYRSQLEHVDRVTIEYDAPDVAPAEIAPKALLAAGWLASRLGWKVEAERASRENETARFIFDGPTRPITVEMRSMQDGQGEDGMLASLAFGVATGDASFAVSLSRDGKRLETEASIEGAQKAGRVLAYEQKTEGQRLSREFGLIARDVVYEQALAVAAQLAEALK